MIRSTLRVALMLALITIGAPQSAVACLCDLESPNMHCGAVATAAFVFEGTVQSVDTLTSPQTSPRRGTLQFDRVRFSRIEYVRGTSVNGISSWRERTTRGRRSSRCAA